MSIKHGTYSTYTRYQCRCDECREASRLYRVNYINKRIEAGDIPHGAASGYNVYRCRCDLCMKSYREAQRRYRQSDKGKQALQRDRRYTRDVSRRAVEYLKQNHPDVFARIVAEHKAERAAV